MPFRGSNKLAKGQYQNARCLKSQPEFSALDKSRRLFLLGLTLLVILFMGASIFYISTHVEVVGTGYEINQALTKKQQLIEENKLLALEIARLKSPGRIETEAARLFDFKPPLPHQTIYLSNIDSNPWVVAMAEKVEPAPDSTETASPPPSKPEAQTVKKIAAPNAQPAKPEPKVERVAIVKPIEDEPDPVKPRTQKLIIAKVERTQTNLAPKAMQKSESKKPKEAVPAVMIDPMP